MEKLKNANCIIKYDPNAKMATDLFIGENLTDDNNYPCFYSKSKNGHKKAWENLKTIWSDDMTFDHAISYLMAAGIKIHIYCMMD